MQEQKACQEIRISNFFIGFRSKEWRHAKSCVPRKTEQDLVCVPHISLPTPAARHFSYSAKVR